MNVDLVKQYESALESRDLGYADYRIHLEKIAALESELSDRRADLERLDYQLPRITDPDEGQRLKREFAECRERSLSLETAIRNLSNQTGKINATLIELGDKCRRHHCAILENEYQRIAATVAHEAAELFVLAKATAAPNQIEGPSTGLLRAFSHLAKADTAAILASIAKRLGIPAQIPKAAQPA
jgi:chromosome segregation ATPase